jgi:hypothetical protein
VKIALVVFLRFGYNFDFDVFEGEHRDDLSPTGHAAAEEILEDFK